MAFEPGGFMEYLQLQGNEDLLTKSELIAQVREWGLSVSDRQLTFYVSEGLIPKSVRVGTRAGVYPKIVAELLSWILTMRDRGAQIESIRELLPVWKYLIGARRDRQIDLHELEYIARSHVTNLEATMDVPMLLMDVMTDYCPDCRADVSVIYKNGEKKSINDPTTTLGFAFAQRTTDDEGNENVRWAGQSHLTLAWVADVQEDPTTVILGVRPNEALPPAKAGGHRHAPAGKEMVPMDSGGSEKH